MNPGREAAVALAAIVWAGSAFAQAEPSASISAASRSSTGLSAPTTTVTIHLRADAAASGPAALTWLRQDFCRSLAAWPSTLDPHAAFELRWDERLGLRCAESSADWNAGQYARCVVRSELDPSASAFELRGTCRDDGHETWQITGIESAPARLISLLHLCDATRPDLRVIDVAALSALLAPTAAHCEDPLTRLLTRGAVECGEVTWKHERATVGDGWVVRGRSPGGLTLPAIVLVLAELEARGGGLAQPRSISEVEQWSTLAFVARDPSRIEATAQLARLGERAGIDVLERLLWADDRARPGAMDALIRAGAADSLPAVIAAANDDWPWSKDLARAAVANLWRSASPAARRATECQLGPIVTAHPAANPGPAFSPPRDEQRAVVAWLAMLTLTIVLLGTHGRAIFGLGRRAA